jgi:hypothetical protein
MRRMSVTAVLIVGSGGAVAGQPAPDTVLAGDQVGRVQVMSGVTHLNVQSLNGLLTAHAFPALPTTAITLGAGSLLTVGRLLVGGTGQTIIGRSEATTAYTTKLSGGYGLFELGFALVTAPHTRVFLLGGGGAGRVTTTTQSSGGVAFGAALANPPRGLELDAHTYLYQAGLGIDQIVTPRRPVPSFSIGLRVGYIGPIGGTSWRTFDGGVGGAPAATFTGPYVRVVIGRGVKRRLEAILPAIAPVVPWLLR